MTPQERHVRLSAVMRRLDFEWKELRQIEQASMDDAEIRFIDLAMARLVEACGSIMSAQSATREHLTRTLEKSLEEKR